MTLNRRSLLAGSALALRGAGSEAAEKPRRYLYVAEPGIRNYVEFGGVGVLVFDIDDGHKFLRRIPTIPEETDVPPENVKGICAHAQGRRLYISTVKRVVCVDLVTEQLVWQQSYDFGSDRPAVAPDGKVLYVPSLEGPNWYAVDTRQGDVLARLFTNSAAHNTVFGSDGKEVYLAGLKSPYLFVADPSLHVVARRIGPFSAPIRPFTVNGKQTLCFCNVNELLGFEIGDLRTGKVLHRVEVQGFQKGPVKRHGCPSHGIGLTPDETEIWLSDGFNNAMHVFDATVMPPRQTHTLKLREQPGWVTFSIDGKLAYPSTGEVFETKSKRQVAALSDEKGRQVHSEKLLEIDWSGGRPVRNGDQFGIGAKR
jgi:hypothetical protein